MRTPSQSYHHLRGSNQKYVTPEKLVKVTGNSGVKYTPISKSINNNVRIRSETIETIAKSKEQQRLNEYIQELEQKIYRLEQQYEYHSSTQQQVLEKRVLQLLDENHKYNDEIRQNQKIQQENEQLKQLIFEQQQKIIDQANDIDNWKNKYKILHKENQSLEQQMEYINMNGLNFSLRKHCSFSEYFQKQN